MSTLTAEPKVRVVEPWQSATAADSNSDNRYRVEHYGDDEDDFDDGLGEEPLPKGWEDELANDPIFLAELDRRLDEIEARRAAGTLVTYTTEEVAAMLDRNFPQLREYDDE